MFIELVDVLRCPAAHEDTWLVAAVSEFHRRHVARGSLGCPTCRAQYEVERGQVWFAARGVVDAPLPSPPTGDQVTAPDPEALVRAMALLGLAEPGGIVALAGRAAVLGPALEDAVQVSALLVNPVGIEPKPGLSTVRVDAAFPVAAGALRAAHLGEDVLPGALVDGIVRALRPRGRLVAAAGIPLPPGVTELARDEWQWVAERTSEVVSPPVALRRG